MKRSKRIISMIVMLVMVFGLFSGCGNQNETETTEKEQENVSNNTPTEVGEGAEESSVPDYLNEEEFPIVKEPITLTAMVSRHVSQPSWDEILVWQEYEKMTGIKIEWQEVTSELTEKRNLALASGDYPDLFYRASVPDTEILKYGSQGVFITLNDLIDKYAPNYKKLLEENELAGKAARMPDGNIYTFVQYTDSDPIQINPKLYVNRTWLDKLEKEMPTTIDELYELLRAFKEEDPNGNGESDEIPITAQSLGHVLNTLYGAWGLRNRGTDHGNVDMNEETGELRYIPVQPEYKEMLQFANKLYTEGLLDQEIFTMNVPQLVAKGAEDLVGAFAHTNVQQIGNVGEENFEGLHEALEGPHGDKLWAKRGNIGARGAFVITDKCEYPEAAVRWIDHFYSEEGGRFVFMGVEEKSYEQTADGEYKFLDEIVNNIPEGSTYDQVISKYVPYAGGGIPALQKTEYFKGGETTPISLKAAENMSPYTPKEIWSKFNFTLEEIDRKGALESDINGYVNQMLPQFIQGKIPFTEWENYVAEIEKMGLDEYMQIYTTAYERYIGE
jgi:putative aldouronate transport system substrate-binding protein